MNEYFLVEKLLLTQNSVLNDVAAAYHKRSKTITKLL